MRTRDAAGLDILLSDDVVFHSPVVHTPQRGKVLTSQYLTAAFSVLFNDSFRYVREVADGHDAVLEFQVEIDGILFPVAQQRELAAGLDAPGREVHLVELPAIQGRDSFLVDMDRFRPVLASFFAPTVRLP